MKEEMEYKQKVKKSLILMTIMILLTISIFLYNYSNYKERIKICEEDCIDTKNIFPECNELKCELIKSKAAILILINPLFMALGVIGITIAVNISWIKQRDKILKEVKE